MQNRISRSVLLFAGAKALAGKDAVEVELTQRPTAAEVLAAIARAEPNLQGLLPACRLAVDRRYAGEHDVLPNDAELALIPPVSGG